MVSFQDINGLGEGSAELLEAAGYPSLRELARAELAPLMAELKKANEVLRILKKTPSLSQLERWIEDARVLTGEEPPEVEVDDPGPVLPKGADDREVNFEADPVVIEMLGNAPLAVPVPVSLMMESDIGVSDVISGVMLTRVHGDIEIRVDTRRSKTIRNPLEKRDKQDSKPIEDRTDDEPPVRRRIDVSKIRSIDDLRQSEGAQTAVAPRRERDALDELRTPSAKLNKGKNPKSRSYIRGVLHPKPFSMKLASICTILVILATPLAVLAAGLLLLSVAMPEQFAWVPPWLLAFPLALPVFGLMYLVFGLGIHCRICNQRLFFRRRCHKHMKAHHLPGLGYAFPMALHMLWFKWFRCTYCGTAVRLKK